MKSALKVISFLLLNRLNRLINKALVRSVFCFPKGIFEKKVQIIFKYIETLPNCSKELCRVIPSPRHPTHTHTHTTPVRSGSGKLGSISAICCCFKLIGYTIRPKLCWTSVSIYEKRRRVSIYILPSLLPLKYVSKGSNLEFAFSFRNFTGPYF